MVRVDEGFMLLSRDLIDAFVSNKHKLWCHKSGDIAISSWIYDIMENDHVEWFHDVRIHHEPTAADVFERFSKRREICKTYLSVHGVYSKEMRILHVIDVNARRETPNSFEIPHIDYNCSYDRTFFNFNLVPDPWYAVPRPCHERPLWTSTHMYVGRGGAAQK